MTAPCAGLTVVEVAVGTSELGLGLAGGVPGMLLADLGADVTRVVGTEPMGIDRDLTWPHAWHRDKQVVRTDDAAPGRSTCSRDADVALVYGPEDLVEARGLGSRRCRSPPIPGLVYARCRPEPDVARDGRRLRPPGRGPLRVLHAARGPPARSDLRRRPGAGLGCRVPA